MNTQELAVRALWAALAGEPEANDLARAALRSHRTETGQVAQSLLEHASWGDVAPYVEATAYDRDGGHEHPRWRLELRADAPPEVREQALDVEAECAACGRPHRPFRERQGGSIYLAVACPLSVSLGCARSGLAAAAYVAIRDALNATPAAPRRQLGLFL